MSRNVNMPCCGAEIVMGDGQGEEWLWKVTNCPYCLQPVSAAEDEEGVYFVAEEFG